MTETTDQEVIRVLDEHRDRVRTTMEYRERYPMVRAPDTSPTHTEMCKDVASRLEKHPVFGGARSLFVLSRQIGLWPAAQASNLLELTARTNGASALAWLYRVWGTKVADIDIITEVHGLLVRDPVIFSNGVRLVAPDDLVDTPQARALAAQSAISLSLLSARFPVAAVITMNDVPAEEADQHNEGHKRYREQLEAIRRTVTALTLSERHTPTTSISWIDFHHPDLIATSFGFMWHGATLDGRQADHPVDLTADAIEWVERFLALTGPVASKCDVALTRLNLARRRHMPGDQAIDGCIALEALLADGQPGDLTYKLRLRAARLLGSTLSERQEISNSVRDFYRLRGKVVHGQSAGSSPEDHLTAKRGLDLTLAFVRKIVTNARVPDITELELGE